MAKSLREIRNERRRVGDHYYGSLTLSEYPGNLVRLSCAKCGRSGQYWKQNLIEHYGADISLPDLREEIAQCGISAFASYRARRGTLNQAIGQILHLIWRATNGNREFLHSNPQPSARSSLTIF
jgi:hypothetical protein